MNTNTKMAVYVASVLFLAGPMGAAAQSPRTPGKAEMMAAPNQVDPNGCRTMAPHNHPNAHHQTAAQMKASGETKGTATSDPNPHQLVHATGPVGDPHTNPTNSPC